MNIHHLELFYFVAKHGGIAAAVRNIPYGIQQPAVSGQIAKLEESLGTKLFQRRPFALSPTGAELYEFIRPFFENIDVVAERLRQNSSPQLRIAAPAIVLHDYLPQILQRVRAKFPAFRLYLHEATRTDAERLLLAREVDLAIMLIDKKSRAGIQVRPLVELPLVLLVPKNPSWHVLKSCGNATRSRKHWCAFRVVIPFTPIFSAALNSSVWNGFAGSKLHPSD
jgi:DNA-binding transcriptional LysR family regulator